MLAHGGVRVPGIASPARAPWLTKYGATPVPYGEGPRERLQRAAAGGAVEVPVTAAYPLGRVADAYGQLKGGHAHGRITLIP